MARMNMKVGEPIDHKHGWSFNSKTKLYQVWYQLEKLDPEYVLITNPSPNAWRHLMYKFCLEVMKWQISRGKGFLVIMQPDAGFAQFLKRYKLDSRKRGTLKSHLACHYFDMTKFADVIPTLVICLCTTTMTMITIGWIQSRTLVVKESSGLIHN